LAIRIGRESAEFTTVAIEIISAASFQAIGSGAADTFFWPFR
jgi:hypothetical protein